MGSTPLPNFASAVPSTLSSYLISAPLLSPARPPTSTGSLGLQQFVRPSIPPVGPPSPNVGFDSLLAAAALGSSSIKTPRLPLTGLPPLPTAVPPTQLLSPQRSTLPLDTFVVVPDLMCAFCLSDASRNKIGRPEAMVSCYECGSSGHPTCLEFDDMRIVRRIREYAWRCENCKKCEVCREKGEDDDMLLCDSCDRGWHRACLTPPLLSVPRGKWTCPTCTSLSTFFDPSAAQSLPQKRLILHTSSAPTFSPASGSQRKHRRAVTDDEDDGQHMSSKKKGKLRDVSGGPPGNSTPGTSTSGHGLKLTLKLGRPLGSLGAANLLKQRSGQLVHRPASIKVDKEKAGQEYWHRVIEPEPGSDDEDELEEDMDPYGGILVGKDADIDDRRPGADDRKRLETARITAETKALQSLSVYTAAPNSAPSWIDTPVSTPTGFLSLTNDALAASASRPVRDRIVFPTPLPFAQAMLSTPGTPLDSNSRASTPGDGPARIPTSNIRAIRFGEFEIETWYQAPFPEEYSRVADGRLWICEFCLQYTKGEFQAGRHRLKCKTRHPPGDEIYRDGPVSVFEVDGRKNKIYCQNLCLLAKMFLDHKTLYYDVEPFLFYVMTTAEVTGAKFVGYFSKEKRSPTNNVSCIMTLPVRQRQGWGNLLIDFSYLLSKKERRLGTPERPLSDLGLLSYRSYWTLVIYQYLNSITDSHDITIPEISAATALTFNDIYFVLHEQNIIKDLTRPIVETPVPQEVVTSPTPFGATRPIIPKRTISASAARKRAVASTVGVATLAGSSSRQPHAHDDHHSPPALVIPAAYQIGFDPMQIAAHVAKWEKKDYVKLRPEKLKWSPFLVTRGYAIDVLPPALPPAPLPPAIVPAPIAPVINVATLTNGTHLASSSKSVEIPAPDDALDSDVDAEGEEDDDDEDAEGEFVDEEVDEADDPFDEGYRSGWAGASGPLRRYRSSRSSREEMPLPLPRRTSRVTSTVTYTLPSLDIDSTAQDDEYERDEDDASEDEAAPIRPRDSSNRL